MLRVLQSPSAAERIAAATEFIRSFSAATELLLVGSSREAVDDLVRGFARTSGATFGLHRFSLTQLAARLAIGRLAAAGVAPSSAVGAEALAVRAAYEAATRNELPYFAPVANFPGFGRATAATINNLRSAGIPAEALKRLEESGPDNAALLERFEEQISAVSVGDRAILFQSALEEVRAGADFAKHPLLFLDVPIHSAIERAFLLELASAAKDVLVTCPTGDLRTLENLRMVPGVQGKAAPVVLGNSGRAGVGFSLFWEPPPPQ